ncbi:plasmid pRiA4b ORF-3 family protein [Enterococcus hirae]|nr:plasmid pRiA4b ORF-3 family protein [Enterococcus hirae]
MSAGTGCYRHLCVSTNETLEDFTELILSAFDFVNDHAHAFFMDNYAWSSNNCYYMKEMDEDNEYLHTCDYRLYQFGLKKGDAFKFVFDFGDDWRFQCKVLRVIDDDSEYETVIKSVGESPEQYFNYFD